MQDLVSFLSFQRQALSPSLCPARTHGEGGSVSAGQEEALTLLAGTLTLNFQPPEP